MNFFWGVRAKNRLRGKKSNGHLKISTAFPERTPHLTEARAFLFSRRFGVLELELIQTQMTQKPVLRAEVYARALRASQTRACAPD